MEMGGVGVAVPGGQDFAERLGGWLSVADAITLRSALQSPAGYQAPPRAVVTALQSLTDEVQQVRETLIRSIKTVEPVQPRRGRADHSALASFAAPPLPIDTAAEFSVLQQRYVEQQRRMEMSVDALRAHARVQLAAVSPELAQLAALDGVMEKMLGAREQYLLATVPSFLKKRFEQLRHEASLELQESDASQTPAWLAQLGAECQQALLAELDLRLQPVAGLAEAMVV